MSINRLFLPVGLAGLTFVSGVVLSSSSVNADDSAVSTASITVPVSCSLIGTTTTAHTAEIPNGIDSRSNDYYPNGIGSTTVKAYCNDSEGFSIYAVGFTGDTIGNTYLRDSSLGQTSDIQTSTTFSGTNSAWAMKIGITNGTYPSIVAGSTADTEKQSGDPDFSTWQAVPSTYTRVAYRNSATDINNGSIASAEGSSITTTYAAYISPTQNSGTYVGKVKYTLVHPASSEPREPQTCTSGRICYFPNTYSYEGNMGMGSISSSATTARLAASGFSKPGYGFAGWNTAYDLTGEFYGPHENITFAAGDYTGDNPGLALYAIWIKSKGTMQDSNRVSATCTSLTQAIPDGTRSLASVSALTDSRDGQTYAIAKLVDGNCWMIENLRLDNTAELTTLNTNNPLNDGANVTIKHNFVDTVTYNTLSASSSVAYDESTAPDGWCNTRNTACYDQSRFRKGNVFSYGNYYNWYSATAGRGTYSLGSKITATGDICPLGWRLPVGGDNNDSEFKALNTLYNNGSMDSNNKMRAYPLNFLFSRVVGEDGSISGSSDTAYYWTATSESNRDAYFMLLSSTIINPGNNHSYKGRGAAVRCLASAPAP